jgi:hypothetical protein
MNKIDRVIDIVRTHLNEESAINIASGGNIAGLPPDEPPVFLKKKRKKSMSGGRGSRIIWLDYLKNTNGRRN